MCQIFFFFLKKFVTIFFIKKNHKIFAQRLLFVIWWWDLFNILVCDKFLLRNKICDKFLWQFFFTEKSLCQIVFLYRVIYFRYLWKKWQIFFPNGTGDNYFSKKKGLEQIGFSHRKLMEWNFLLWPPKPETSIFSRISQNYNQSPFKWYLNFNQKLNQLIGSIIASDTFAVNSGEL